MLHSLTIVVIALTLIACSDGTKEAKQMIKESIGPNSEFELRNVRTFPGEVVCGEYLIDKRASAHPFIAVRDMLYKNPGKLYSEFFCSEAPANVLQESTGIGPYNADNSKLGQITNDFSTLVIALESYYHDYASYPTIEQGLQALASPPDNPRSPTTHSAEATLKRFPLTPGVALTCIRKTSGEEARVISPLPHWALTALQEAPETTLIAVHGSSFSCSIWPS